MTWLKAVLLLSALSLVGVFLFHLFRKRDDNYAVPFLLFTALNLSGIAGLYIESSNYPSLWNAGYIFLFLYLAFLPTAWYFLTSRWGIDEGDFRKRRALYRHGAALVSTVLFFVMLFTESVSFSLHDGISYLNLNRLQLPLSVFYIISIAGGLYQLENCYRSAVGLARERVKKSYFPLVAYGLGFLALSTIVILYAQLSTLMLALLLLLAALVSMPVARHFHLFDPVSDGIVLTRRAGYSSISIVLIGLYLVIVGTTGHLMAKWGLDQGLFFTLVVLVLIVFTFGILIASQAVKSRMAKITEQTQPVLKGKNSFAGEWKEFSEEISVSLDIEAIFKRTGELLRRMIKIEDIFLLIKDPAPSENFSLYTVEERGSGVASEHINSLVDWLARLGKPVLVTTLQEKASSESEQFEGLATRLNFPVCVLVPLMARQQLIGIMGLGFHASGRESDSDEISFIEAITGPISLTILASRMTGELIVSREMESFHKFSSFVLHDLKNSVGMLSMLLQNAEKNIADPRFQREALTTIAKAVERQKKIISRLTEEESSDKLSLQRISLAEIIKASAERVRLTDVDSVETSITVNSEQFVIVDPAKIGSVFDNLFLNALEAMPGGGRLKIESCKSSLPGLHAISVTDTGEGMDAEFIATRLFKPFGSTKEHGLGIGMFQAREIVTAHHGRIDIVSEPGQGTTFTVYLPKDQPGE
jgi:hypothetical protein